MADDVSFDQAVAMLSANQGDNASLFRIVATGLAEAIGSLAEISYAGRFGKRASQIVALTVRLSDAEYQLSTDRGALDATVAASSGGVRIRTTRVGVDEWLVQLRAGLATEADRSERARVALERLAITGATAPDEAP